MEDWQDVSTYSDSLSFLDKAPPCGLPGFLPCLGFDPEKHLWLPSHTQRFLASSSLSDLAPA